MRFQFDLTFTCGRLSWFEARWIQTRGSTQEGKRLWRWMPGPGSPVKHVAARTRCTHPFGAMTRGRGRIRWSKPSRMKCSGPTTTTFSPFGFVSTQERPSSSSPLACQAVDWTLRLSLRILGHPRVSVNPRYLLCSLRVSWDAQTVDLKQTSHVGRRDTAGDTQREAQPPFRPSPLHSRNSDPHTISDTSRSGWCRLRSLPEWDLYLPLKRKRRDPWWKKVEAYEFKDWRTSLLWRWTAEERPT